MNAMSMVKPLYLLNKFINQQTQEREEHFEHTLNTFSTLLMFTF